ncbi:MAG: right-handed parallel beta-helix repeat-containing protein, partial [Phycisphaerae bacterium]
MSTEGKINIQLITAAVLLGIFSGLSTAETIYVDSSASGANDGSSWTDAFNFLQDGLSGAEYDDEIRVAEGIYYPSVKVGGTSDRNKTFQLINGVAIYGGFPSGGGTWADRDSDQYETILSGDIDGDDIIDPNKTENSYHVFYHPEGLALEPNAVLDGFTITAGNANLDSVPHRYGGGMLNWDYNSPTVTGCTFTGNSAYWVGGGMCNSKSSPAVTNCTFIGNSTEYLDGGGMFNNQSNPIVTNCSFTGNSAVRLGGGMHNDESSPAVTDCTFIGNLANKGGGGMCNSENSPTVTNCTFGSNSVEGENSRGGGMLNYTYSSPEVSHCTFSGNSADDGGGMANDSYSSPTVTDCTFTGNEAGSDGGGMYNEDSNPTATNCNFTGNSAYYGGGMKNWRSNSIVVNCTFSGNSANLHGGGMYN